MATPLQFTSRSYRKNYNEEINRIKSFLSCPFPKDLNKYELAKCGFYATGNNFETQCNWCQTKISNWRPDDQIMDRHRLADPFCQFLVNPNGCGNIPKNDINNVMNNSSDIGNSSSNSSNIDSTMMATTSLNVDNFLSTSINSDGIDINIGNQFSNGESSSREQQRQQQNQQQNQQQQEQPQSQHQPQPQQSTQQNLNATQFDLKNETHRLATFRTWPNPNISPESLAKAGFYYFNKSDHVKCAWCKGVIAKWEKGDNAFHEHDRFFPGCPRAQLGPLIEFTSDGVSIDGIRDLGIQQISPPKTTKFSCLDARMRTYSKWPIPDIQNPEILAQAGFYYQEIEDQVRCFHCNGGLRSWQKEDDPWFEHAKWFPHCNFLKLVKGPNFVTQIRGTNRQQQSQLVGAGGGLANVSTNNDDRIANNQEEISRQTTINSEPIMNLEEALQTIPVQRALEMGLNEGRVLNATRRHLESNGRPFDTTEELVEAVLEGQVDEEDDANGPEPSSSIVREVSRILHNIFNPRNQSTTTAETGDYDFDDITDFHAAGEGSSSLISSLSQNENINFLNRRSNIEPSILNIDDNNREISSTASTCDYNINNDISSNSNSSNTSNLNRDNNSTLNENQHLHQEQETNIDEDDDDDTTETSNNKNSQVKIRPPLNEQQSLEEENRKLKDARTCKVCMDDEVGVVFLPCGHLVTCVQCAPGVTVCPLCRSAIRGFVRTFLS